LSTSIDFPLSFSPQATLEMDGDDTYQLIGAVVHLGTAAGGHYKAFVKSSCIESDSNWMECNDDHIHVLTTTEFDQLFKSNEETASTARQSIMENVYLLLYTKSTATKPSYPIPSEVSEDNSAFQNLVKLETTRRQLVETVISVQRVSDLNPLGTTTLLFSKDKSITEITQVVYDHFVSNQIIDSTLFSIDHCRVRRFSSSGAGKGETFAGRDNATLKELGFGDNELLCFEIRTDSDPEFVEFNANDMIVYVKMWSDISAFSDETQMVNQWNEIIVSGREVATVGALRSAVSVAFGIPEDALLFVPFDKSVPLTILDDDAAELRKKYKIHQGNRLIVEKKADITSESVALYELKSFRSRVCLHFNNPLSGQVQSYDNELQSRLDASLLEVKQAIAERLAIALDSFHLRRNENSPQFKDESKSLSDLDITDLSILHVQVHQIVLLLLTSKHLYILFSLQMGKGCSTGEHMLRFELDLGIVESDGVSKKSDAGRFVLLDEIAVSEKFNILSIKKLLHGQWAELSEKLNKRLQAIGNTSVVPAPPTPNHIRLRDLKGGKTSGPLRDERIACRCLLGMADGRRIAVQILPNEEIIGGDDLLIAVRVLSYDKKTISESYDISIPRTFNVQNLLDKLNSTFPELSEPLDGFESESEQAKFEIAKGYTTGPVLNLKSGLKLKWNDVAIVKDGLDKLVDRPPLNLRDGSIIAIRGRADWLRAQARVRAKKEATLTEGDSEVAVGGGASAVRARAKALSANSEPVLKFNGMPPYPEGSNNEESLSNDLPQSPNK
jgi:hypothetical protein